MHDGDTTFTPLQFIYEPSNCRLFYTIDDIYDIGKTWTRVADAAWGNGPCVPGSSLNLNNTISQGAYDTVPFSSSVVSAVDQPYQPGLLGYSNATSDSNNQTMTEDFTSGGNNMLSSSSITVILGAVALVFAFL